MLIIPENPQPLEVALHKSFCMVYRGYGMTAVNEMDYFSSIVTRALLLDIVRNEARDFKGRFRIFRETHPDTWELGRLMNLEGVNELNHANFPHLYHCAMARARTGSRFVNYKKSEHNLPRIRSSADIYSDGPRCRVRGH